MNSLIEKCNGPDIQNSLNMLISKSGASFAGEALLLREAGFSAAALKAYVPAIEQAQHLAELVRAFEGGDMYGEPLRTVCCVCGKLVFKAKGSWWLPICSPCHDKGWKSEPYYGHNYSWSVFLDQDSKTAHAVEEY